ncbi:MAG: hypothetical protein ACXABO_06880 [Promethearchaeota archaeon]
MSRHKKLIAFAIIESNSFNKIIPILNNLLKKRLIQYYSLQLNTFERNKIQFILFFEEIKKESIVRAFSIIHQKLNEGNAHFKLLENSFLERQFLNIIIKEGKTKTSLRRLTKSILVTNNGNSFFLDFFTINLQDLDNKDSFILNFINIIKNFNRKGYLICNFLCDNNEEIKFSLYFAEIIIKREDASNTEQNVNNFFNYNLIKKRDLKIREIFNYLWRRGIDNNYFLLKFYSRLFTKQNQQGTHKLSNFNREIEKNLLKNGISFIRFSDNLLFIEQSFLFLGLVKLKPKYIQKVIKRYMSKYFIYILILSKEDTEKLLEIESIISLKNIKILESGDITNFNFNEFREKLKNP